MKALPSIAFNEFRGTAGDVTARRVGGSTVLNGRAQHSHVKSPKQSERRAHFSYITKQFRLLTDEQRSAWASLAAQHRERALVGGDEPLTAFNLFVCLNANRALLGVAPTFEAPSYIHGSSYIAYDDIWLTPTRFMIGGLQDPENENARLVVRIASTASNGVTKLWGNTVVLGKFHESDWGDVVLTEAYLEQFGVPIIVGQKYFLELYWMDEYSGYVSEISRVCYPAVDDLSIHGNEYVQRIVKKTENVINTSECAMTELDFEVTSPYRVVTVDLEVARYSGYSAGFSVKLDSSPDPGNNLLHFLQCRADADAEVPYCVSLYECRISNWNGVPQYELSERGGLFITPIEIFGTALALDKLTT